MNKETGVTLIELLVIISIIGILALALGFSYQGWVGNYRVESQVKELYADLMDAQVRAMTRNRMHFAVLSANSYQIFADDNPAPDGDGLPDPADKPIPEFTNPKNIRYQLGWTGTISFDTRGLTSSAATITIPVTVPSVSNPDYDCIRVDRARIWMGKMSGVSCDTK